MLTNGPWCRSARTATVWPENAEGRFGTGTVWRATRMWAASQNPYPAARPAAPASPNPDWTARRMNVRRLITRLPSGPGSGNGPAFDRLRAKHAMGTGRGR